MSQAHDITFWLLALWVAGIVASYLESVHVVLPFRLTYFLIFWEETLFTNRRLLIKKPAYQIKKLAQHDLPTRPPNWFDLVLF